MKRFLCLLLAMIFVLFALAGCNNETASTGEEDESETEKENEGEETGDAFKFGMSIKDPSALLAMILGGEANIDIKNVYIDVTTNESAELVYALGAKLFGKSHNVKLFAGEDIVLSAPTLLDKNYGISYEAFMALYTDMIGNASAGSASVNMKDLQALEEPAARLVEKYSEMLLTELRTNAGLTIHRPSGAKYVQISGKMNTDNLATIIVNVIEELCKDEDFFTILKATSGTTKAEFLAGKPPKAELLSGLKQELKPLEFEADVNLTVDDEKGVTKADIKASFLIREKAQLELKFDVGAKYFELYVKPAKDSEMRIKYDNGNVLGEFNMTNNYESIQPGFYEEQRNESINGKLEIKDNKLTFDYETKDEYYYKSLSYSYANTTRESSKIDLDASWSDNGIEFSFTKKDSEYDSSYGKEEEKIISAEGEFKVSDTGMVMSFEYDDTNTQPISMEMKIAINGEEVKGTLTMNGQKMGEVIMEKKVSGSKTTITIKSIDMGGAKIDVADAGISFYVNTAAAMPKVPEYTSVENFDADDFEAIGEKFMVDNAELIEKLSGLFGAFGGGAVQDNMATPTPTPVPSQNANGQQVVLGPVVAA